MALPVLDKTWELTVTELRTLGFGISPQDNREAMFQLKESLVNGGVTPWTVDYSYDKVTLGTPGDGIDRWASRADVSWGDGTQDGTGNESWIVLKQAGMLANFQLMIRCHQNDTVYGSFIECYISPSAGFTGGTASTRPSATDEVLIMQTSPDSWLNGFEYSATVREHVMYTYRSTDGECTRVFIWNVTEQRHCMHFQCELAKNPIPEWTVPVICGWYAVAGGGVHSYGVYNDSQGSLFSVHPGTGGKMGLYLTGEGYISSQGGQNHTLANDLNGEYAIYPMGVASGTLNAEGRHGEVFDMWWIPTSLLSHSTMPLTPSATREFMVFDDMLMVHDGSVPIVL
jgi:hypothetical protein